MALSCIISEIKRDIGRKSRLFHTPPVQVGILPRRLVRNERLSYRRQTARCFVSLNISLSHLKSLKVIRN